MKKVSHKKMLSKTYETIPFEGKWLASFGLVEMNSRWLVYGESSNGKTEFVTQLAAELCNLDFKVWYVSAEQKDKSSIQQPWVRNIRSDNATLIKDASLGELEEQFLKKRKSRKALIIDSLDYIEMTQADYKRIDNYKAALVFVSWAEGRKPMTMLAKKIKFMVDLKIYVKQFAAFPLSRYGGNEPFIIYPAKAKQYHSFLNH